MQHLHDPIAYKYPPFSSIYHAYPNIYNTYTSSNTNMKTLYTLILFLAFLLGTTSAEQCGHQAGGALCPNGLCCSEHGWCGTTTAYCGTGCQSQCAATPPPPPPNLTPSPPPPPNPTPSPPPGNGVATIISATLFDQLLKYRNDPRCKSNGFYTYNAFIAAANSFHGFGTTGDADTRKREIAAFLAQTSHETKGE